MKFSIITPTFKRAAQLARAVQSVQAQTYKDWEMIIVNDSPADPSYHSFASSIEDSRIHYHLNDRNRGVNFTRNSALDKVSADSKWVVFLDDDDYLSPDALETFSELIQTHSNEKWLITNRALKDGTPVTKIKKADTRYSYILDYLLLRRCKGDVTHAIKTDSIHLIRFPHHVKQGEEWLFFYQLGLSERMFYHDHNSTITDGYSEEGLNFRKRTRTEQLETLSVLVYEGVHLGLLYRPTFLLYLALRSIRTLTG